MDKAGGLRSVYLVFRLLYPFKNVQKFYAAWPKLANMGQKVNDIDEGTEEWIPLRVYGRRVSVHGMSSGGMGL